jgi:small subunit ribosomal protein S11
MKNKAIVKKKDNRKLQDIQVVFVYIKSTFNNIILSITTQSGAVLFQTSAGACGFKGPKKSTPYAGQVVGEKARTWLLTNSIKAVSIILKGPNSSRESAVKALASHTESQQKNSQSYVITLLSDVTPVPHNGCRSRKIRKV